MPVRSPGPKATPGMVLVVDDEPLMLRALGRILREDGHQLVLAESPDAADAALADPALDVALLDLVIGTASGLETARPHQTRDDPRSRSS